MKMKFKCDACGHVTKTPQGISSHIRAKHPNIVKGGFTKTRDAVTNPNRNGPHKVKKHKSVIKDVPVITTGAPWIDIPCVLRVHIGGLDELSVISTTLRKS